MNDPFHLDGQNLRQVMPQIRRSIKLQQQRVVGSIAAFVFCLAVGGILVRVGGIAGITGLGFLAASPLTLIGVYFDLRLLRQEKVRLNECERQLSTATTSEPSDSQVPN